MFLLKYHDISNAVIARSIPNIRQRILSNTKKLKEKLSKRKKYQ